MIADLQRQLGIDSSFFIQFGIFIFIFLWLRYVYFGPYLELILKREKASDGMSESAAKMEQEAVLAEKESDAAMAAARKSAATEKDKILNAARAAAATDVAKAREQAKKELEAVRAVTEKEISVEMTALKQQSGAISALLVEKLTKTKVGI